MKQFGIKIVWGDNECPPFPDDWKILRCPMAATVAVSPEGKEYLIGDGVLYPWLTVPPEGLPLSPAKPGSKYVDIKAARPHPLPLRVNP